MRSFFFWVFAVLAAACASAPDSKPSADDAGSRDDGSASTLSLSPGTFSYVYENYFGPRGVGHCGSAGCHGDATHGGFHSGTTKDDCYVALTTNVITSQNRPLVDPANPTQSLIVDPRASPVTWFNDRGTMPEDNAHPNDKAKADVLAWLRAGATND